MEKLVLNIAYESLRPDELDEPERLLVERAKAACQTSYAPYSRFCVGAAARLANGEVVCGSNQENAAFPSGTCAERCTVFYANARYPDVPVELLAIAAHPHGGEFTSPPITPCGACRQVLLETEKRQGRPLGLLLYGRDVVFRFDSVRSLLPFCFDGDAMR